MKLAYAPLLCMLLASTLFLAACSRNEPNENKTTLSTSKTPAISEPCDLITKQEAETLLGEPLKEGEKTQEPAVGMKLCMYNPVDDASTAFLQITLTHKTFMKPDGVPPESIFNTIREAMSEDRTDLQDLGDGAFIATGGIYILSDGYYITIGAGNIDRAEIRERLKTAAAVALDNLKTLR